MKKILLTTLALTTISAPIFAEECCHDEDSNKNEHHHHHKHSAIYLRADILGQKFHKAPINGTTYKNKNYSYGADFGLGYHVMERIRAELIYNYNFMTRFKANSNNNLYKGKIRSQALFLRGMVDVISFKCTQFFVGAGAGIARTSNKLNIAPSTAAFQQNESKTNTNFAYSFHAGVGTDIAEGVMFEVSWSMRNYGTTGNLAQGKNSKAIPGSKLKLKSQVVTAGFRFEV